MKKISFSLLAVTVLTICTWLTSCSNKYESVEDQCKTFIPDDVEFVLNVDLSRLIDATDSEVGKDGALELSEPVEDLLRKAGGRDVRAFLENLAEFKGCAYTNLLIAANFDKQKALVILPVSDEDAFIKSVLDISRLDFDKEPDVDGYKTIESNHLGVLVKDNLAFIAINSDGPMRGQKAVNLIDTWREKAADEHIADWKIDYLAKTNATTLLVNVDAWMQIAKSITRGAANLALSDIPDWTGIAFDIDKEQLKFSADYFKKDGSEFKTPYLKKFDTDLLDYATAEDIAVMGAGFDTKEFNELIINAIRNERASDSEIAEARKVLGMFNGQFMIAAGPTDGLNSFGRASIDNWHFVLAAKGNGNALRAYIAQNLGKDFESDGSIELPTGGEYDWEQGIYVQHMTKFYTIASDDIFVFSNAQISKAGNSKVDKSVFADSSVAFWAALDRNNAMLENLKIPFGLMLTGTCLENGSNAEIALKVTGTDKSPVDAVVDAILGNI